MTKKDYINYRLDRAYESFEDAKLLAENDRWNTAINRLYYASFYSIIALLIKNGIETQTHDGVRTQFGLQFVIKAYFLCFFCQPVFVLLFSNFWMNERCLFLKRGLIQVI